MTLDVRTSYCPLCGSGVETGKGFRCRRCGQVNLCPDCGHKTPEGYVCGVCLVRDGDDCQVPNNYQDLGEGRCGEYAKYKCVICDRPGDPPPDRDVDSGNIFRPTRVCEEHSFEMGVANYSTGADAVYPFKKLTDHVHCEKCGGLICPYCAIEVSEGQYSCPRCGSRLKTVTRKRY